MGVSPRGEGLRSAPQQLEQTLEVLVAFLRSEAFAVKTYEAALARVQDPALADELGRLRDAHIRRVELLRQRIAPVAGGEGGEPWGAFANAYQRLLAATDDVARLEALQEGERWGVADYEIDLREIPPAERDELAPLLLAAQRESWAGVLRLLAAAASHG
jgi:hypothetical protein